MNKLDKAIKLRSKRDFKESENIFLEILENNTKNDLVHYHYAWLLDNIGNEKKAIKHYRKALNLGLNVELRADCYLGLGSSYRLEKKYKKSIKTFDKAINEFPNNLELEVFKTLSLFEQRKSKKAYLLVLKTLMKVNSHKGIETYSNAVTNFIDSKIKQ